MPTYDYICSSCGRTSEIVHSINGGPPAACPACGAVGTLRKSFNPPTIHFKGSGWAKKDRSGGSTRRSHSAESSSTNGSDGDSTKSTSDQQASDGGAGESGSTPASSASQSGRAGSKANSDSADTPNRSSAKERSPKDSPTTSSSSRESD
ncbi:MAG: FmdB family zinc ribbon protein [Candidatus Limnocylindrales bacterium]